MSTATTTPRPSTGPAAAAPPRPARPARRRRLPPPRPDRPGLGRGSCWSRSACRSSFGGDFKADYSAPGSDSSEAQQLLESRFPAQSGDTVDVVVRADGGLDDPADPGGRRRRCSRTSATSRTSPRSTTRTPRPGAISPDGRTLVAHAKLDVVNPVDMPVADSEQLIAIAEDAEPARPRRRARRADHHRRPRQREIGSEGIGLAAAAIILLLMFGSVVAAGLPLLVAVAGPRRQQHADRPADRVHRRPRLVHLAGHDDGHRHRHRLRAADGHPVPRVAGRRPRPARRDRRDAGHRRPRRDGRRQHRGHLDAGPVRDGPVVHARRRPRHHPRPCSS